MYQEKIMNMEQEVKRTFEKNLETEIKNLIEKNYKRAKVMSVGVEGECVFLIVDGVNYAFVAKRILDRYNYIKWVYFEGGFVTSVYSRHTLLWAGYYGVVKSGDKKEVVTIRKASDKATKEVLDAIK